MRMTGASDVASEQVLGLRDVLQQARQIAVPRQILADLRDGRGRLVVGLGEFGREALGVDRPRFQRSLQHPLEFGDTFDRRVAAGKDQYSVTFIVQWEDTVGARKRIRHPSCRGRRRRNGIGRGYRCACTHDVRHSYLGAGASAGCGTAGAGGTVCGISDCRGVTGCSEAGVNGRNHGNGTCDGGGVSGVVGVSGEASCG